MYNTNSIKMCTIKKREDEKRKRYLTIVRKMVIKSVTKYCYMDNNSSQ